MQGRGRRGGDRPGHLQVAGTCQQQEDGHGAGGEGEQRGGVQQHDQDKQGDQLRRIKRRVLLLLGEPRGPAPLRQESHTEVHVPPGLRLVRGQAGRGAGHRGRSLESRLVRIAHKRGIPSSVGGRPGHGQVPVFKVRGQDCGAVRSDDGRGVEHGGADGERHQGRPPVDFGGRGAGAVGRRHLLHRRVLGHPGAGPVRHPRGHGAAVDQRGEGGAGVQAEHQDHHPGRHQPQAGPHG